MMVTLVRKKEQENQNNKILHHNVINVFLGCYNTLFFFSDERSYWETFQKSFGKDGDQYKKTWIHRDKYLLFHRKKINKKIVMLKVSI